MIEAGRTQNIEKMNILLLENSDTIFASIYNIYINQNWNIIFFKVQYFNNEFYN